MKRLLIQSNNVAYAIEHNQLINNKHNNSRLLLLYFSEIFFAFKYLQNHDL